MPSPAGRRYLLATLRKVTPFATRRHRVRRYAHLRINAPSPRWRSGGFGGTGDSVALYLSHVSRPRPRAPQLTHHTSYRGSQRMSIGGSIPGCPRSPCPYDCPERYFSRPHVPAVTFHVTPLPLALLYPSPFTSCGSRRFSSPGKGAVSCRTPKRGGVMRPKLTRNPNQMKPPPTPYQEDNNIIKATRADGWRVPPAAAISTVRDRRAGHSAGQSDGTRLGRSIALLGNRRPICCPVRPRADLLAFKRRCTPAPSSSPSRRVVCCPHRDLRPTSSPCPSAASSAPCPLLPFSTSDGPHRPEGTGTERARWIAADLRPSPAVDGVGAPRQ
ncbi:hypothetical protein GW17_00004405 [Ensete ventricosum]|nr:hypothetical protein GW17_00004405 [Ensete ventricosum]